MILKALKKDLLIKAKDEGFLMIYDRPKDRPIFNGYYAEWGEYLLEDGSIVDAPVYQYPDDAIAFRIPDQHQNGFNFALRYNSFHTHRSDPFVKYFYNFKFRSYFKIIDIETGVVFIEGDPIIKGWFNEGRLSGLKPPSKKLPNGLILVGSRLKEPNNYELKIVETDIKGNLI